MKKLDIIDFNIRMMETFRDMNFDCLHKMLSYNSDIFNKQIGKDFKYGYILECTLYIDTIENKETEIQNLISSKFLENELLEQSKIITIDEDGFRTYIINATVNVKIGD